MDNVYSTKKLDAKQFQLLLKDISTIEYYKGQWDVLHPCCENPPETMLKTNAGIKEESETEDRDTRIARASYEILLGFHSDPDKFILSPNMIKSLHYRLFHYSAVDAEHRGRLRSDLSEELKGILETLRGHINDINMHTVLSVSIFRHEFLELMPFVTANTQLANLLSYFLLAQNDYSFIAHSPFLAYISEQNTSLSKEQVFMLPHAIAHVLEHAQNGRSEIYLNRRRSGLLEYLHTKESQLKISDIMNYFPNESRNTIKKDLLFLRNNFLITARGEGRGMNYSAREPNNTDAKS